MRGLICADDGAVSSLETVVATRPSYFDSFLCCRLADSQLHGEYQQCFHFQLKKQKVLTQVNSVVRAPHGSRPALPRMRAGIFSDSNIWKDEGRLQDGSQQADTSVRDTAHQASNRGQSILNLIPAAGPLLLGTTKQATPLGCLQASSSLHPGYNIY